MAVSTWAVPMVTWVSVFAENITLTSHMTNTGARKSRARVRGSRSSCVRILFVSASVRMVQSSFGDSAPRFFCSCSAVRNTSSMLPAW